MEVVNKRYTETTSVIWWYTYVKEWTFCDTSFPMDLIGHISWISRICVVREFCVVHIGKDNDRSRDCIFRVSKSFEHKSRMIQGNQVSEKPEVKRVDVLLTEPLQETQRRSTLNQPDYK